VHCLTSYLQNSNIPHNLYVTRGSRLDIQDTGEVYSTVRVYVWARKSAGKTLVNIQYSLDHLVFRYPTVLFNHCAMSYEHSVGFLNIGFTTFILFYQ
jgi:hypothetical protein